MVLIVIQCLSINGSRCSVYDQIIKEYPVDKHPFIQFFTTESCLETFGNRKSDKNDKTSEFSNPWTVFRLIIFPTKHRIPPSPNGSRFSRKVTGCSNHWFEWQSNVYLVGISRKNWWSPGPVKKFVMVLVNGKKCVWNRCALIRERDEKLWDYENMALQWFPLQKLTR